MDLPIYKVIFDEENINIFGMSLVDVPANQTEWITMSKDEPVKMSYNEEKHLVSGVVLRPGQLIYRNPTKSIQTPFYMSFEASDIEKFAFDFLIQNNQNNLTLNHEKDFNGAKLVESYLTKNEDNAIGVEKGSWILTYKVFDMKLWEEIKEGKFNGFSLEGYLSLVEDTQITPNELKDETDDNVSEEEKDLSDEEFIEEIKKLFK